MTALPHCYVCHGSLLQEWTDALDLPQAFDDKDRCVNVAAWECNEGAGKWEPMCTTHKLILADRVGYQDFEFRMLPYVIEEEEAVLDAKVDYLFAKARQMAQQSPNYIPKDERTYISPDIDDLLKKHLKDALSKK